MSALSPWHLIILVIEVALFAAAVVAGARILRRLGYSGWWVLLAFVPVANVIGLWQLSKSNWPALNATVFD